MYHFGGDNQTLEHVATRAECEAVCSEDPGCRGYEWADGDPQGPWETLNACAGAS